MALVSGEGFEGLVHVFDVSDDDREPRDLDLSEGRDVNLGAVSWALGDPLDQALRAASSVRFSMVVWIIDLILAIL